MKNEFEKIIAASRPEPPDTARFHRLNRTFLLRRMERPARRRRHRVLATAGACVLAMALFLGPVTRLGGDDLETRVLTTKDFRGEDVTVFEDTFDKSTIMGNMSEAEARDYGQALAADDGDPSKLMGISYGGRTQWTFYRMMRIDGILQEKMARIPDGLPQDTPPNYIEFLTIYNRDMKDRITRLAPEEVRYWNLEGVLFEVKFWSHNYPGYGKVIFARGYPVANTP